MVLVERLADGIIDRVCCHLAVVWLASDGDCWNCCDTVEIRNFSVRSQDSIVALPVSRNNKAVFDTLVNGVNWDLELFHDFGGTLLMQYTVFLNTMQLHLHNVVEE